MATVVIVSFILLTAMWTATLPRADAVRLTLPISNPSNTSVLGGVPTDSRFSIQKGRTGNPLDPTACKVVALQFMGELALLDWESNLGAFGSPIITDYPAFILGAPQPPLTEIPSKYLIWGAHLAMTQFIQTDQFVETEWLLFYNRNRVGILQFLKFQQEVTPSISMDAAAAAQAIKYAGLRTTLTPQPTPSSQQSPALKATNDLIHIRSQIIPGSQFLDRDHVWLALYATLQHLAFPNKDTILVEPFIYNPASTNIKFSFTSQHVPGAPRHEPPFLQYSAMILSLRQLPSWMLSPRGNFRETVFAIYEGGTFLGVGSCKWSWRLDSWAKARVNVSTF